MPYEFALLSLFSCSWFFERFQWLWQISLSLEQLNILKKSWDVRFVLKRIWDEKHAKTRSLKTTQFDQQKLAHHRMWMIMPFMSAFFIHSEVVVLNFLKILDDMKDLHIWLTHYYDLEKQNKNTCLTKDYLRLFGIFHSDFQRWIKRSQEGLLIMIGTSIV